MSDKIYDPQTIVLTILGHEVQISDKPIQVSGDVLITDAQRYRWLLQNITEVLCEGKATDCYSKYLLPRLTCEDSTGRRYTFDEIIDIQMKRSEISEG